MARRRFAVLGISMHVNCSIVVRCLTAFCSLFFPLDLDRKSEHSFKLRALWYISYADDEEPQNLVYTCITVLNLQNAGSRDKKKLLNFDVGVTAYISLRLGLSSNELFLKVRSVIIIFQDEPTERRQRKCFCNA